MKKVFYVNPNGNDGNTGEQDSPFQTIGRAQRAAREYHSGRIIVESGIYRECLFFTSEDNDCEYIGDNVILSGGSVIAYDDTQEIPEEVRERLSEDAAAKVRVIDLSAYGYSSKDWGDVYPIGRHSAEKYDDGLIGVNLEVFSSDKRMILARYPNQGYLKIDAVKDCGDCYEFPMQNRWDEWFDLRNPRGGTFIIDTKTNDRVKCWKNTKDIWIFGYFQYDWADSSTPVSNINTKTRAVSPKYASEFAYRKDAEYYFYNVLEELDMPGEYYLDRSSGLLYVYPYAEGDEITVSISAKPLITVENTENLLIEGFQLMYARNNGVELKGNYCTLRNLLVKNVAENGIMVEGIGNIVENCEITQTGRGGIWLKGGERITLTPGQNKAINNYIHHYSVLYQTYQAGIRLEGVDNCCLHNEICFSPHCAVFYQGNGHMIEYNYIHDVVQYCEDAGAIYSGMDWAAHGTVIRYNIIRNVGCGKLEPDGIYWDDALSGQTAYGNILINVKRFGFQVGGGRDNTIKNNIIIGESRNSIYYDTRAYSAYFKDGWFTFSIRIPDGELWEKLRAVPYNTGIWAEKYPLLAKVTDDVSKEKSPDFPVNPANVIVEDNIIINSNGIPLNISKSLYLYSYIGVNHIYTSCEEVGFNLETLKLQTLPEGFEEIPVEKIGRCMNC